MLSVSNVSKAYGGRVLFEDACLQVNREDRIGLVGPNGAGKTTLFRLILRQEEPDAGDVVFQRGIRVGFLPQESAPVGDESVLELALGIGHVDPTLPNASAPSEYDGQAIARARRILKGLAFRDSDFERPAKTLSGGWVMRAHLARLLVSEPDLLMLDEPTNHLDLETLLWFQEYLRGYPGGILLISHDREFLNQLITSTVELRLSHLYRYAGNYDEFLAQREAHEANQLAAYKNQQKEIERLMDFVARFRAKNTKASQAQAKLKQIDRMEKVDAPEAAAATVDFAFPQPPRSGQRVIQLTKVHHAYGANVIYRGIDFEAERGQRVVLVGPNGAGKSTLLKLLAGVLDVQEGERKLGYNVTAGYYAQYRTEMLDPTRTVLDEALSTGARVTEQYVRTLLGCFLFRDDDVFKRVSVLSGGEKSRLALVKILLEPPNLLLMDEPTTHLDMSSIDALVAALSEYTGTLVFISHDVHFIRSLAERVVHVNAGRLTWFAGDYDYYLQKSKVDSARAGLVASGLSNFQPTQTRESMAEVSEEPAAPNQKERKRQAAEARQIRSAQKKKVAEIERRIAELETRQAELTSELEKPETYTKPGRAVEVNTQLRQAIEETTQLTASWETEAARLLELENEA